MEPALLIDDVEYDASAPIAAEVFRDFLARLPEGNDVEKSLESRLRPLISKFNAYVPTSPAKEHSLSEIFNQIRTYGVNVAKKHSAWKLDEAASPLRALTDCVERYLCAATYNTAYKDAASQVQDDCDTLHTRCSALAGVVDCTIMELPQSLEIPACLTSNIEAHLDKTDCATCTEGNALAPSWICVCQDLYAIRKLDNPQDKLVNLVNACRVLSSLVHAAKELDRAKHAAATFGSDASSHKPVFHTSTDDLLPSLAYTVLKLNLGFLPAEVSYINAYRSQRALRGESGFYLTLCESALQFLLQMQARDFPKASEACIAAFSTLSDTANGRSMEKKEPEGEYAVSDTKRNDDDDGGDGDDDDYDVGSAEAVKGAANATTDLMSQSQNSDETPFVSISDITARLSALPKARVPLREVAGALVPPVSAMDDAMLPEAIQAWLSDRTSLLHVDDARSLTLRQANTLMEEYKNLAQSMEGLLRVLRGQGRADVFDEMPTSE